VYRKLIHIHDLFSWEGESMNKRIIDLISSLIVFGVFKLFSLGSNYEALVIVILANIYWKIGENNGN